MQIVLTTRESWWYSLEASIKILLSVQKTKLRRISLLSGQQKCGGFILGLVPCMQHYTYWYILCTGMPNYWPNAWSFKRKEGPMYAFGQRLLRWSLQHLLLLIRYLLRCLFQLQNSRRCATFCIYTTWIRKTTVELPYMTHKCDQEPNLHRKRKPRDWGIILISFRNQYFSHWNLVWYVDNNVVQHITE